MDTHDREILRRRVGPGELALDVAYVTSLLRKGVLGPERVELASRLGHPVAVAIYPMAPITNEQFQDLLAENQTGLDDKSLRLFAVACARRVLPIFEESYPNDPRPRNAIEAAERFALGQASKAELREARNGAYAAVDTAYAAAAYAAARAAVAAGDTAGEVGAAGDTARMARVAAGGAWAAEAAEAVGDNKERLFQRRLLGDFLLGLIYPETSLPNHLLT